MSISGLMDKQNMVYPCTETLVIKENEVLIICHNVHEPFKCYTDLEEPGGKRSGLCNFIYTKHPAQHSP